MNCIECFKKGEVLSAGYIYFGKSLCAAHLPESLKKAENLVFEIDALRKEFGSTQAQFKEILGNLQIAMARLEGN